MIFKAAIIIIAATILLHGGGSVAKAVPGIAEDTALTLYLGSHSTVSHVNDAMWITLEPSWPATTSNAIVGMCSANGNDIIVVHDGALVAPPDTTTTLLRAERWQMAGCLLRHQTGALGALWNTFNTQGVALPAMPTPAAS